MELLTPLQKKVLEAIGKSPIRDSFYLTGGTALAAFYLHNDYWLAAALRQAGEVTLLPRMIKPLDLDEMKRFFLARAKEIMDRIG